MTKFGWSFMALVPILASAVVQGAAEPVPRPSALALEFFEKRVRPVLVDNCYNCHSANTNAKGGLRVDDRNGLLQGGSSGPAVVPGKAEESLLVQAVSHADDGLKMPPKKKLSAEQIADLTRWIEEGAAWPDERQAIPVRKANARYEPLRKTHWAWQPLREPGRPELRDGGWPRTDVDRFILAGLEAKGLAPVGDADRGSLIRRLTFDLTGLPPTPEEVDAFVADESPEAFERTVDRLLASPAFGERWGRHWLDVARYGESTGSSRNVPYPHAWRYRDYVIEAFNRDVPFDRFVREQVAGDLLPASSQAERDEHVVATGFLALGVKDVNQRFKVRFVMDNVDEQIDTVSRSVLGLTASCARCHDHKFDPIPQEDYYALAGIFRSTDLCAGVRNKMGGGGLDYYDTDMLLPIGPKVDPPSDVAGKIERARAAVEQARAEFEAIRNKPEGSEPGPDGRPKRAIARQKLNKRQQELLALTDPASLGPVALGVRDAKTVGDTELRIRGEAERLGPVVARGFLSVLKLPNPPAVNASQSGRLELADWLTRPENPLTPRVAVNRVWSHLFGQGIVRTVDNFGVTGDVPSHPELLDHLALEFVRDGWSMKRLVRRLVLSRAYQLGSEATTAAIAVDPGNRLVWRHAPRRLDAEEIRDATLVASGSLDPSRPEGSAAKDFKVIEIRNNGPDAARLAALARKSQRRSVYLPLLRGLTPTSLEVFDFAEQGMVTGSRDTTTVATQALYLLNDPFVRRQSLAMAERLLRDSTLDDGERIRRAYRLTLGREPSVGEFERSLAYVAEYATAAAEELGPPSDARENTVLAQAKTETAGSAADSDSKALAAATSQPGGGADRAEGNKKVAPPQNVDEVVAADVPVEEDVVRAETPRAAAWASFCQALIGSGEFRYLQ